MKRTLLLTGVSLLLVGCAGGVPPANEPPAAYISSISPTEVTEGETVEFSGYGTDVEGEVVGYRWRSNIDGELSSQPSFQTNSLSVGDHIIYFMVKDDSDEWSDEVTGTVRVQAPVVTPPTINSFESSVSIVPPRDNVSLSWDVSHADTVSIDQGIGTVSPTGSIVVAPGETTTYELTATGSDMTDTGTVTITVDPPAHTITLTPEIEISGFIRSSGAVTPGEIFVGDDDANRGIRGFLTYDISRIPDDGVITQVMLDLSGVRVPYGLPFDHLGCLSAFEHPYNTLHGEYLMPGIPGQIGEWCDFDDLKSPDPLPGFRDPLQDSVGTGEFQFRLQFADMETDGDGERDMLQWPRQDLPPMTVEYYVQE